MTAALADPAAGAAAARPGKYLTFALASEKCGIEIRLVHEILQMLPVTQVPRTPPAVRGVVNLRGRVIPIVSLRRVLGMPTDDAAETCIVVVDAGGRAIGVTVDRVNEVLVVDDAALEPPPSFGTDVDTAYLLGVAKAEGRVRLLLDIERVLRLNAAQPTPSPASTAS